MIFCVLFFFFIIFDCGFFFCYPEGLFAALIEMSLFAIYIQMVYFSVTLPNQYTTLSLSLNIYILYKTPVNMTFLSSHSHQTNQYLSISLAVSFIIKKKKIPHTKKKTYTVRESSKTHQTKYTAIIYSNSKIILISR